MSFESQFIRAVTALVALCSLIALGYKSLPAPARAAFEIKHPRAAGFLRVAVAIGWDVIAFVKAWRFSIVGGRPHPNALLELMRGIEADPERMRALIESLSARIADETLLTPPSDDAEGGRPPADGAGTDGSRAGFVRRSTMMFLASVAVLSLAARGCRPQTPDGCSPASTRCSPEGVPQWCSPGRWWSAGAAALPCRELGPGVECRLGRSPYDADGGLCQDGGCGRLIHACLPSSAEQIAEPEAEDAGHD